MGYNMTAEEKHIAEIKRVSEAMKKTKSKMLYRDYAKYRKRLLRELQEYRRFRHGKNEFE